ncbi:MAG: TAT-variant-translocated molybdopterin oxidoreductase [Bacteroidia bacterium]
MKNNNKYWRGLEELNNDPKFLEHKKNEFAEGIPLEEIFTEEDGALNSTRRDFLKYFGFSVSAVALAACNKTPVKHAIPYVVKPENVTPGIPNWYATTCNACSANCSILVKTREGRPVKIEGNSDSPVFKGGVCATGHASLLGLYDNDRLRNPQKSGSDITWEKADEEISSALSNAKSIRIVSGTINSPSTKKAIQTFINKFPNTKHIQYEAVSLNAISEANNIAFGKDVIPGYRFDKAKTIVSFGADFLGTWISPTEYTKQWIQGRKVEDKKMSRHIQFESLLTITGSKADVRYPIKPSAEGVLLISLYNKIATLAGAPTLNNPGNVELALNMIELTAKELWESKGQSLVVSGSNSIDNQLLVNAINSLLGNIGSTVDLDNYSNQHTSNDSAFENFVNELSSGAIDAVIFYNTNPVYFYRDADKLAEAIKKVSLSIATNPSLDETSSLCKYNLPDNHYLESWNDHEPKAGYFGLTQPTITNVFNTRQTQETLLKLAGTNTTYYEFIKDNWKSILGSTLNFNELFNKALHDGFYMQPEKPANAYKANADLATVVNPAYQSYVNNKDKKEVIVYPTVALKDGSNANNPWLQELPDPISKVCWDNYVAIGKATADEIGVKDGNLVNVTVNGKTIEKLPVLIQAGQPNNTVSIPLGYGRTNGGKVSLNVGKNAYPLTSFTNNTTAFNASDVTIEKVSGSYELAQTQTHHTIEGRDLIREASLNEFIKDAKAGNADHHKMLKEDGNLITLWSEHDSKGHKWAMAIDLNKCTGCGACVVSCNAENNVPVVGRKEVLKRREMHWIRIDRYYSFKNKEGVKTTKEKEYNKAETGTDFENVRVTFQPVMCQQCGHAPCETVCPVLATVHSSEGLNHMAYNRCVGTRYCANNCPYKVRRFNWFKYRDNDEFDFHFNNDLGRMVINPDVTVRSRGVMEKCSFCIQRIQAGKLAAKIEGRKLKDGDVKTACQQSCPADAIIFGDINNPETEIAKHFNDDRSYVMLEEYNVQPSVAYKVQIRNVDENLVEAHGHTAKHNNEHDNNKEHKHTHEEEHHS